MSKLFLRDHCQATHATDIPSALQRLGNELTQWRAHMRSTDGLLLSPLRTEHLLVLAEPPGKDTHSVIHREVRRLVEKYGEKYGEGAEAVAVEAMTTICWLHNDRQVGEERKGSLQLTIMNTTGWIRVFTPAQTLSTSHSVSTVDFSCVVC